MWLYPRARREVEAVWVLRCCEDARRAGEGWVVLGQGHGCGTERAAPFPGLARSRAGHWWA